jgi:acetyltransferase-like isoleucine patch superfamily enzyme
MITFGTNTYCADPEKIVCYEGVELIFGKFCSIASGLKIVSGQHPIIEHPQLISQYPFKEQFGWNYPASKMDGKVTVGNDVWIGEDVTIIEGITIGNGAIIGACSVVAADVLPYTTVVGNPAKIIKLRTAPGPAWWDWKMDKIKEYMETFK